MGRPNLSHLVRWLPVLLAASFTLGSGQPRASAQTASPDSPQAAQTSQPPAPPDDQPSTERTVRLSDVEGKVQIYRAEELAFAQATINMPLTQGMRIVTGADGRAEVQFEDGSVARVAPNSSILLADLSRSAEGSLVTGVAALTGLTYYEVNGQSNGQFAVQFGSDTAVPLGSAVLRVDLDTNPATVSDFQGQVQFLSGQSILLNVQSGQTVSFDTSDPAQYTTTSNITPNSWDQWNADRDQQLAQLAQDETTARAGTGAPNDPAWNDLDYYGDWYDVPGYGEGWAPSGVGSDFDPFADGAWGYYPSFGYTWISAYPWGWWPYHCGAWNWFGGSGWMWFPGNCGAGAFGGGWYPYSGVWRVPPGFRPPVRPLHRPVQSPGGPAPMLVVNRAPEFSGNFRLLGDPKPPARPFQLNDTAIRPLPASIHPQHPGPTGDSFVAALLQTHPEIQVDPRFATPLTPRTDYVPRNAGSAFRPGSAPGLMPSPQYRPGTSQPRYTPPSVPSFHPAPAPSAGGHPSSGGGGHPSSGGGGGGAHH